MKIFFSKHAIVKMNQRNLDRSIVLQTLKHSDKLLITRDGREEAYKKFRNLYLKVVFITEPIGVTIITAHFIAKPRFK